MGNAVFHNKFSFLSNNSPQNENYTHVVPNLYAFLSSAKHKTAFFVDDSCGSVVAALHQQRKSLWVQFPGNMYTGKNDRLNAL